MKFKKLLSAAVLAVSGFTALNAEANHLPAIAYSVNASYEAELPEAIKAKIASDFKDWTVSSAELLKTASGTEYYAVALKKGEDAKTINFSKEGQVLETAAPAQATPSSGTTAPAKADSAATK